MCLFIQWNTSYKAATYCFLNFGTRFLYSFMFALLRVLKVVLTLLIFALEQKLKVHWNGLQKTFLLSYYTSKSEQAENSLVLPILYDKLMRSFDIELYIIL